MGAELQSSLEVKENLVKEVQVGNDQEKARSEKDAEVGKN